MMSCKAFPLPEAGENLSGIREKGRSDIVGTTFSQLV